MKREGDGTWVFIYTRVKPLSIRRVVFFFKLKLYLNCLLSFTHIHFPIEFFVYNRGGCTHRIIFEKQYVMKCLKISIIKAIINK